MFGETGRFDSVRTFTVSRALIQLNPHSNTVEGQTLICLTHFSCLRDTCDAGVRREPDLMILFLFESCFFFFFFIFRGYFQNNNKGMDGIKFKPEHPAVVT